MTPKPKVWRSWRVCPACGGRATKIVSVSAEDTFIHCQQCGCDYDPPHKDTKNDHNLTQRGRLSDERLRELCDPVPKAMPAAEVPEMARELLDLRAKLSAGPVMPGSPSDSVWISATDAIGDALKNGISVGHAAYHAIRAALAKEQGL